MVGIGESFRPHPDLKKLYYAYFLIPVLVLAVILSVAGVLVLLYAEPPESWVAVSATVIPYLVAVGFVAYWIPRYFRTVSYTLADDRIIFQGGLWWKVKSFVPYNRITNIDIVQGPLSRRFGLGKVSVQTAGYSGQSGGGGRLAEIAIFGVKDFDEIKDAIMAIISRYRPVAVEAGVEAAQGPLAEVLHELRRIREDIEAQAKS